MGSSSGPHVGITPQKCAFYLTVFLCVSLGIKCFTLFRTVFLVCLRGFSISDLDGPRTDVNRSKRRERRFPIVECFTVKRHFRFSILECAATGMFAARSRCRIGPREKKWRVFSCVSVISWCVFSVCLACVFGVFSLAEHTG